MATRWRESRNRAVSIALFATSLAISGCEKGPSPPAGLLASPEARQEGGVIFAANCAICHGVNGDGSGRRREGMNPAPANLTLPPWSDAANAGQTFLAIHDGVPRTAMASWKTLGDHQIWELVAYITSLKSR